MRPPYNSNPLNSENDWHPYLPLLPFFAKYPFLKSAGSFLQKEYGSLLQVLKSEKTIESEAKELGKGMVLSVLGKQKLEFEYPQMSLVCTACEEKACRSYCNEGVFGNDRNWQECRLCGNCFEHCNYGISPEVYVKLKMQAKISSIAYLFSRLLISCLEDWVRRRYAIKEAERYAELIRNEDPAVQDDVLRILAADLGIEAIIGETVSVHVSAYLKGASRIKAENWRLVNRKLKNGYVELTKKDFIRLIEEYLRERLEEKLEVGDEIKKMLEPYLADLEALAVKEKKKFSDVRFEEVDSSCFPPCMKKILSDLQSGVNVPHSARFAITAFLLNIGLDVEEVLDLFRPAPDFNEEKTRYQVEHIAGAKGTEYDCPACDTMRTYHNCYADESCSKTYHPIAYYEWCMRKKSRQAANTYKPKKGSKGDEDSRREAKR